MFDALASGIASNFKALASGEEVIMYTVELPVIETRLIIVTRIGRGRDSSWVDNINLNRLGKSERINFS